MIICWIKSPSLFGCQPSIVMNCNLNNQSSKRTWIRFPEFVQDIPCNYVKIVAKDNPIVEPKWPVSKHIKYVQLARLLFIFPYSLHVAKCTITVIHYTIADFFCWENSLKCQFVIISLSFYANPNHQNLVQISSSVYHILVREQNTPRQFWLVQCQWLSLQQCGQLTKYKFPEIGWKLSPEILIIRN